MERISERITALKGCITARGCMTFWSNHIVQYYIYISFIISCYKLLQWNLAELVEMAMERERENPCCPSVSSDNSWLKRSGQRRISMTHVAWMHPLKIRLEYRGQQLWHKPMWTCMILHNYVPGVLSRSHSLSAFATFYSGVTFIRILYDCSAQFPSSTRLL